MAKIAPPDPAGTQTRTRYALVPRDVYDDDTLSDAAVRLFCVLDGRVTGKGSQQIRQDTIAEQLRWSRRKVQRALGELVAAGYITTKATARSSRLAVHNPVRQSKKARTKPDRVVPSTGNQAGTTGTSAADASNLAPHNPSSVKSGAADASNLAPLYRNTSLRNTDMTAQPPPWAASAPSITAETRGTMAAQGGMPDADGPEITPDRVLVDYVTEIWRATGHNLDRNRRTDPLLTRIHQHGIGPQDAARLAAEQLSANAGKVRNPAGFLVSVVLPGIANQILTAPPAPKPTPIPPPVAEIAKARTCMHGAEIGRCAICRSYERKTPFPEQTTRKEQTPAEHLAGCTNPGRCTCAMDRAVQALAVTV